MKNIKIKALKIFGIFSVLFLFLGILFLIFAPLFVKNIENIDKVEVKINNQVIIAKVAKDDESRARGLGGINKLGINEGMLFVFEKPGIYGFWMKNMLIPIDIVWIYENKVLGWEENVSPPLDSLKDDNLQIYYPPEKVNLVLEIPAGRTKLLDLKKGMEVNIKPLLKTNDLQYRQ